MAAAAAAAAAYQLVYTTCVSIGKNLRNTWSLKARARLLNTFFFHIYNTHTYYIYTISSLSRSISLPSCVEAIRNPTTNIIYLTCGQSIHTRTHIYYIGTSPIDLWPRGRPTPLPPPAAYAVSVGCYIIYRFRRTVWARVRHRAAAKTRKDDSARTYLV